MALIDLKRHENNENNNNNDNFCLFWWLLFVVFVVWNASELKESVYRCIDLCAMKYCECVRVNNK